MKEPVERWKITDWQTRGGTGPYKLLVNGKEVEKGYELKPGDELSIAGGSKPEHASVWLVFVDEE